MTTSSRAPKHVWTKEEEGTLVECLVDLVSMRAGNQTMSHPAAKWLLNNRFCIIMNLHMFGHDRMTVHFVEIFTDAGSNEPIGYERFDMLNENEEFPSVYSQGIDMSKEDIRASRPSHASEGRTESSEKRGRGKASKRALLKRHLLSRMDDMRDFIQMPNGESESFCRVILRNISR
ncbi:retrotransposon protein [Cucumis melo var. makuwa]|uniref:Retrotransposon protein n=1 Tax=Cucumis melo var. makuwa TaxID=1194695 RepID=A0A5A7T630_CUCMM|nr:retrotransposon protein [Cucumis melo var. makuwa]TYK09348.1 retrotransposon protein [Cucumis melo var. makuwa]